MPSLFVLHEQTAVLSKVASLCGKSFTFRRLLRSEDLLGQDEAGACDSLVQMLQDAHQCPTSLLLLDDLEALIHWCGACHNGGGRFSSARLHTLLSLMGGKRPPPGRVCCVVASTSLSDDTLRSLGLLHCFNKVLDLPLVASPEQAHELLVNHKRSHQYGEAKDCLKAGGHSHIDALNEALVKVSQSIMVRRQTSRTICAVILKH